MANATNLTARYRNIRYPVAETNRGKRIAVNRIAVGLDKCLSRVSVRVAA